MVSVRDTDEMVEFLKEILTENEIRNLVIRWDLMNRLYDGTPQRTIAADLGISLCRITRGARILRSGGSVTEKLLKKSRGDGA